MELRMQPRSEGPQTLRSFQIVTNPRAQLYAYTDYLGNAVYHFNVLRAARGTAHRNAGVVEMAPRRELAGAPILSNGIATTATIFRPNISICWSRRNSRTCPRR